MKENNKINLTEKQQLVFAALSIDGILSVNKQLLSIYGHEASVYISYLIDTFQHCVENQILTEDGGFSLTYEIQQEHIGMSEHQLRKCKNKLKEMQLLTTELRGIPPKEFYFLQFDKLIDLINIPKKTKN